MQAVERNTVFVLAEKAPTLRTTEVADIKLWLHAWRQYEVKSLALTDEVAPVITSSERTGDEIFAEEEKEVKNEPSFKIAERAPSVATSKRAKPLMYQYIDLSIHEKWVRHEVSLSRMAEQQAAGLSSSEEDSDDDIDALAEGMRAIILAESAARRRMQTDEGIKDYILREFGPRDVLASWRYYKNIRMQHFNDFSSFDAAAVYVQEFDAARTWCQRFPIQKEKLGITFINGVHPQSLRDELLLSSSRNYFRLSATFLCRYAELSKMARDVKVHRGINLNFDNTEDGPYQNGKRVQSKEVRSARTFGGSDSSRQTVVSQSSRASHINTESRACNFCNTVGHIKKDCRKWKATQTGSFSNTSQPAYSSSTQPAYASNHHPRERSYGEPNIGTASLRSAMSKPAERRADTPPRDDRSVRFRASADSSAKSSSRTAENKDGSKSATRSSLPNNYDNPGSAQRLSTRRVSNKMIFRTDSKASNSIPTIAVALSAGAGELEQVLMRAQLDSGSEANVVSSAWQNTLQAVGIDAEAIPPITVGWIREDSSFKVKNVVRCHTHVVGYSGIPQGVEMTFLVMDGAGEELIIGIESMRQLNLFHHADAIVAVQKGLGLLYSNPNAEEDPPIIDLEGNVVDIESRYGPEASDVHVKRFFMKATSSSDSDSESGWESFQPSKDHGSVYDSDDEPVLNDNVLVVPAYDSEEEREQKLEYARMREQISADLFDSSSEDENKGRKFVFCNDLPPLMSDD